MSPVSVPRSSILKNAAYQGCNARRDSGEVEAEKPPEASWAVFINRPAGVQLDEKSPSLVGSLALLGVAIRSEARHEFKPGRFVFPLNRVLQAALKTAEERILVTVEPIGLLINGKPSPPEVKSPVRIGKVTLFVEHRKEGPKEGSEKPE